MSRPSLPRASTHGSPGDSVRRTGWPKVLGPESPGPQPANEVLLDGLGGAAGGSILLPDPPATPIGPVQGREDLVGQQVPVLGAVKVALHPDGRQGLAVL